MDAFEQARLKHAKNLERKLRSQANQPVEIAEKKPAEKVPTMLVSVSGPVEMTFEVHYSGALLASQTTPQALREMLIKQLSPMGRVTCR